MINLLLSFQNFCLHKPITTARLKIKITVLVLKEYPNEQTKIHLFMKTQQTALRQLRHAALLLLFLFYVSSIFAQENLQIDWQREITNSNGAREMELSEIESSNGFAYVAGYSSTENGQRMYVARYNPNGTKDWELNLPSTSQSSLQRLVLNDDAIYVAGVERFSNSNNPPIHYARLNPDGEVVWHYTFDAEGGKNVELSWMEIANDRLYMIGSETGENGYDIAWAAEFELDGSLNWKTAFDPGNSTVFTDINVNTMGSVAACGWAETDIGYSNLLISFDETGSVVWQYPETLTDASDQWLNDLSSDGDGNWIAVGSDEVGSFSEYDAITYKFDTNGNELWNKHFNNGSENYGSLVEVLQDGSIRTFVSMEEDYDKFVRTISYDTNGNELWATNYTIDGYTSVINAMTNTSGETILGVSDFDFAGFVKLSSAGEIIESQIYDNSNFDYLGDIAVEGNNVFGCAYTQESDQSTIIALKQEDLTEIYNINTTGASSSDARIGALVNNGNNIWIASYSDSGDSAVYSITKMDYMGNTLWSRNQQYLCSSPTFKNLTVDASGNVIGFYESLINGGVTDLGLVKYDAEGNEVFTVVYDSTATLYAGAIVTDPSDNIYVGGYNQNSKLMFLSKLNPNGNEVWNVHYKSPSSTFPYGLPKKMLFTEQGKLVIAAFYKNAENVNNLYLFQYASDGSIEWQTEVVNQSGNSVSIAGLQVEDDGTIIIFGSSGTGSYVAASYNILGAQQWIVTGETNTAGTPVSLSVDDSGNSYLCFSSSTGARFQKLDAAGNVLANQEHDLSSSGDYYFPLGSSFVQGKLAIVGNHRIESITYPFEMVLDDQLNLISGRVDSLNPAEFGGFVVDAAGKMHAGFTQGETLGGSGFHTGLVRQYSKGTVGINDIVQLRNQIKLYPNPAKDQIHISSSIDLPEINRISILDVTGRIVLDYEQKFHISGYSSVTLDLPPNLKGGQYILRVSSDNSFQIARFVKF